MNELFLLLDQISSYLVVPVILAGFYHWNRLALPLRLYVIGACLSGLIVLFKEQIRATNAGFYISAMLGVTLYGGIFHTILHKRIDTRIIWIFAALIWALLGWYALQHGVQTFQLWIIIPYDLFMISFCMVCLLHYLQNPHTFQASVFYLIVYLLMEFLVNLFLDMMSNFLNSYFSDSFMTLLWKRLLPAYNILRFSFIMWILLTVKPKLPSLDKIPSFEK